MAKIAVERKLLIKGDDKVTKKTVQKSKISSFGTAPNGENMPPKN
jgi:hypothetical protein